MEPVGPTTSESAGPDPGTPSPTLAVACPATRPAATPTDRLARTWERLKGPSSAPAWETPTSGLDPAASILSSSLPSDPTPSDDPLSPHVHPDHSAAGVQFNLKEPSPIKEALLTKFAKLAPTGPHSPHSLLNESRDPRETSPAPASAVGPSAGPPSWLNQVKGRIAKTVEERYAVYKTEKEHRKTSGSTLVTSTPVKLSQVGTSQSLDLSDDDDPEAPGRSQAQTLSRTNSASHEECHRLSLERDPLSSLPHSMSAQQMTFASLPPELNNLKATDGDLPHVSLTHGPTEPTDEERTPVAVAEPAPARRKFTFSSFLEKRAKDENPSQSSRAESVPPMPIPTTSANQEKTTATALASPSEASGSSAAATPTRTSSLRLRMMGLMGKAPSSANHHNGKDIPVSLRDLNNPNVEDPFAGITDLSPDTEADLSFASTSGLGHDHLDDFEAVETAMEADEMLVFDPSLPESLQSEDEILPDDEPDAQNDSRPEHPGLTSLLSHYWWVASLPICILALLQLLPFPSWLIGFITGFLIALPIAAYVMWTQFIEPRLPPRTKFIENVRKRVPKQQAIIVQEELDRKYIWMNLWPPKNGPYDPLTYDVRRTMSVRVMLHGPWIELKFPKRNLPLRRMYDDQEPTNMVFLDQKEIIDLTNCAIDLIPENLPSKRIWSKKYPIRIRTNQRKPPTDLETSQEIEKPDSTQNDPALFKDDGLTLGEDEPDQEEREEMMFDAVGDVDDYDKSERREDLTNDEPDIQSSFVLVQNERFKTFYLFTRTSREKEEWFNRFMVGARFMQDWNHQNPPRERQINPDQHYLTFKVREQRFKIFMENYFQARHMEGAERVHNLTKNDPEKQQVAKEQVAVLNIFGGRLWYDLHNNQGFIDLLREKITRKLLKVKIAQYFRDVSVTTLDMGQRLPQILSASLPWQDENGLWVDFDIEYQGICQATVETNGIRLPGKDEPDREAAELLIKRPAATMDSDEEDSAEEDDDLPDLPENTEICTVGSPSDHQQVHGATFKTRMLENLLKSDFVAKMATSEWVKKNITERNITLQLQLHSLKGTLTLNFPPAPSDRVWYGFRTPPDLEIALRPCFGGKGLGKYETTFSSVMRQLENRLKQEFMKVLVYPNLDDEVLPFLDHVDYSLNN
ncbi:testis-expressed protein 2-like isoform X2 [Tigriopus californicus]|uniref:testis-expressed protein 2-like isoform X2 n=1 Tax=Tigriopus californicus TaxID=6832 RepID=UPI0027DA9804|nr:testis-expressed protein 2-like isoform X2 [Tigriopus californicus]